MPATAIPARNILAVADPRGQGFLDGIAGAPHRIGVIFTEGGNLRQRLAGNEQRVVVVGLQLDAIGDGHFSPRSFKILFTNPLPSSLPLPCIGNCVLRSPRRTVRWPEPPLWVSKVQPRAARNFLSSALFITILESTEMWSASFCWPRWRFFARPERPCNRIDGDCPFPGTAKKCGRLAPQAGPLK